MEQQSERRKTRRFSLRQSALVRSNDGVEPELTAQTQNVSLKGALLSAENAIPEGSEVEVRILLQREGIQDVALRATGKVVRRQPVPAQGFEIAVAFEKPLAKS